MSRQLRIQYPGAIYHVTSRGDRSQAIVADDVDRDWFFARIGTTVEKFNWEMFACTLMTNHLHLFFRILEANLSRGMQFLLGGYASWWNARHKRTGHVFQGRFGGHLVEDESYFWTVSRYVHLNPVPVLVARPEDWPWSSYAGYVDPRYRVPWISYEGLLQAWAGLSGGADIVERYQRYVEGGLADRQPSPFSSAIDGWILGSEAFADKVRTFISPASREPTPVKQRQTAPLRTDDVVNAVCERFQLDEWELMRRNSRHPARALFAYLGRQYTDATLRELAEFLGLSRPDSVPTLIRRVTQAPGESEIREHLRCLQASLARP